MGRYAIFNGLVYGGGTVVIPNPEGTPTDELHSIQIDEDIYEIVGGGDVIEKTQAEYDALTPAQKANGSIYMVEGGEVETAFDMTNIVKYIESNVDVTSSQDETTFTWDGGSLIGMTMYYTQKVDLTNAHTISYSLTTGTCYGGNPLRNFAVGVCETAPSAVTAHSSINYAVHNVYDDSDASSQFSNETLDVSELTGEYYIVVTGFGWNATLSNIATVEAGEAVNKIYYMGTEYANTNGGSGGGSQELISYDTTITTTQYGWWTAEDKDGNTLDPDQYELIAVTPLVNNSSSWVGAWDGAFYINSTDGVTHRYDVSFVNINDGGYIRTSRTWDIKVIYRDKNATSGGGGSTVVPNPQEEPTDTLNTVEIDGVVYNIEGGSEGEGVEIYSEDEYIVGKWVDGKKVYQKTFSLPSTIVLQSNTWTTINDIIVQNAHRCIQTDVYLGADDSQNSVFGKFNNGVLSIFSDIQLAINAVTIRYTKTVETDAPAWGGSVNNYYANFIDTDNVIDSGVYNPTIPLSYTASEDCFVVIVLIANNNPCIVSVDNKEIYRIYDNGVGSITVPVPIKKGQTITATTSYSAEDSPYTVYGISYGSGGSSSGNSGINYSTDEQDTGIKWIDGSPIYQKTIVLTNLSLQQGSNTFALSTFNISNVQYVIEQPNGFLKVNASDIRTYPFGSSYSLKVYATPTNLVIERTGNDLSLAELTTTIRYIKTTT